jgi:hypothetical protein
MRHWIAAVALSLALTGGWWDSLVQAAAEALGFSAPTIENEQATTTPPPPSTDSGCSIDPWGCPNR